jgi:transcription initiation factor TFIIIB Brf1 subunit/transcription initiation factor TFIIB
MPKKCEELGYPHELCEDAQKFVEKIQDEGQLEGCQCSTIVGVALLYLNQRLYKMPQYTDCYKGIDEIASAVKIGVQTIKDKADKIKCDVIYLLPKNYLDGEDL